MVEVASLQARVTGFRDERDWARFHNPKDLAVSLALEAGEVLERFQWKDDAACRAELSSEQVADELADVLYWVLLMAHDGNIDIAKALERKLEKNAQKYPVDKSRGSAKKYTELRE